MSKSNPVAGQIGHGGNLLIKATHVKAEKDGKTVVKTGNDLRNKGGK